MGYVVEIGNAVPRYAQPGDVQLGWVIDTPEVPGAITYEGDGTFERGIRCPSVRVWGEFIRAVGLYDDLCEGFYPVTEALHGRVLAALAGFRVAHPDAVPRFHTDLTDANLARLEWVEWWVRWVRANCEHPAIDIG